MSDETVSRREAEGLLNATTPGPWFIEDGGVMNAARSVMIAHCGNPPNYDSDPRLVAAAPRLAATVVQLHDLVDDLNRLVATLLGAGMDAAQFRAKYLGSAPICGSQITGYGNTLMCTHPVGHEGAHGDGQANWTVITPPPFPLKEGDTAP